MSHNTLNIKVKVWRQKNAQTTGAFVTYDVQNISDEMSFLEMLDVLNERLISEGQEPIAFDHDCREGICGMCSLYIDGKPHGPWEANTTCQLHMRKFSDGDEIWEESESHNRHGRPTRESIVDSAGIDEKVQREPDREVQKRKGRN